MGLSTANTNDTNGEVYYVNMETPHFRLTKKYIHDSIETTGIGRRMLARFLYADNRTGICCN